MDRIFKRPWLIIGIVTAITVFFGIQLPKAELDNDVMNFIPSNHPDKLAFERLDDLYGLDLSIAVAVHRPYKTILDPEGIELIQELTDRIGEIPHVNSITSLTNIDYIAGTEAGLSSMPLTEGYDGSSESIQQIRQRLNDWPAYDGTLISDDYRSAQMAVALDAGLDADAREDVYFTILDILEPYRDQATEFHVAGEPAITVLLSRSMRADMVYLIPAVVVVVVGLLTLFFRRVAGVVLPLVTVIISTVWTIGLMALLGIKLSLMATVIPVLMVAVGSAYGIHIVNHYFHQIDASPEDLSRDQHRVVIYGTLRSVGVPVLMAGLTTIVGFGALATSEVIPMRDFGIFTAIGVLVALVVALALIPSVLLIRKHLVRRKPRSVGELVGMTPDNAKGVFISLYKFFGARKGRILIAALLVSAGALYGALQVVVDNELIAYFKANTQIRQADRFLRDEFLGTRSFDINVSGPESGSLTNPEILKAMDDLAYYLESTYTEVTKVVSYADFIKRMNQAMNVDVPPPGGYPTAAADGVTTGTTAGSKDGTADGASDGTDASSDDTGGFGGFSGSGFGGTTDGGETSSNDTGRFGGFSGSGFGGASDETANAAPQDTSAEEPSAETRPPNTAYVSPEAVAAVVTGAYARANRADISASELVRLVNRELNYRGWSYYEIPYDPSRYPVETRQELQNLITQYLLLYSGELTQYADDSLEPQQARMTVQLRTTGNLFTQQVTKDIHRYVDNHFPEGYDIEITGVAIVERSITGLITDAQIRSIILSLTLVFLIVSFTFRSGFAGLFGIIPLSLTLLVNFGVMGYLGIKLDAATAMVSSIAIGIGIDYTIHLLSSYHKERQKTDDLEQVEIRVLSTTGKAIMFNALSVAAGFGVLVFSQFNPIMYMGILIAITMLTSSIASLTVLPVLLDFFKPRFMQPKEAE